jgi:hypothetical protein
MIERVFVADEGLDWLGELNDEQRRTPRAVCIRCSSSTVLRSHDVPSSSLLARYGNPSASIGSTSLNCSWRWSRITRRVRSYQVRTSLIQSLAMYSSISVGVIGRRTNLSPPSEDAVVRG